MTELAPTVTTLPRLIDHAAQHPTAGVTFYGLRRETEEYSYARLLARARCAAAGMRARGVEPGDRVALIVETEPAFFDAWFGAILAGAVPACLYPPVRLGRLRDYHWRTAAMIESIDAKLIVAGRRVARLLGKTRQRVGGTVGFVRVGREPQSADDGLPPHAPDPDDLAMIQFSSGTTVRPKPVALTHRQLLANLDAMIARFPGEVARHRTVSWLPLYHDMGLIGAVTLSLYTPTPLVLIRPEHFVARPQLWLQAITDTRASVTVAPNFAYGLCVEKVDEEMQAELELSSLEVALNGAEPVHPGTIARFVERFADNGLRPEAMTPVYGLAEVGLAVAFSSLGGLSEPRAFDAEALAGEERAAPAEAGQPSQLLASVGPPLPAYAVEIRDSESGAALEDGRVGTVWVRGPSVMEAYYGQPERTAAAIVDGWLDSGDRGFLLDGELYLCGRVKDLLIIRGRNHDPAVIEQAASELDGVRKGCVVALALPPDGDEGEGLLVLAERRGSAVDDESLAAHLYQAALSAVGVAPQQVVLLEPGTLPRTSSGKLRRAKALRQFLAGELTPPDQVTWFRMARSLFESWLAHRRVELFD